MSRRERKIDNVGSPARKTSRYRSGIGFRKMKGQYDVLL